MSSPSFSMLSRRALRAPLRTSLKRSSVTSSTHGIRSQIRTPAFLSHTYTQPRLFSSSSIRSAILPDSSDPPPREAEPHEDTPSQKTDITIDEYHTLSDHFLEGLIAQLEARQEEKNDIDVEYSVRHPIHLRIHHSPTSLHLIIYRPASSQSTCPRKEHTS
jgi:frataxin